MNGDKIQKYKKKIQNKCDEMCTFLATLTYVFGTFCNQNALTNGIKFKTSYSGQRTFYIKKATREKKEEKNTRGPKSSCNTRVPRVSYHSRFARIAIKICDPNDFFCQFLSFRGLREQLFAFDQIQSKRSQSITVPSRPTRTWRVLSRYISTK